MPVRNPHESLERELVEDTSIPAKLRDAMARNQLPPSYAQHPVVAANEPGTVLPVAVYMDGVQHRDSDSVVAVWLVNMISGRRHICALIRKSLTCKCGCRGWDTFFPVLIWLRQCLKDMADGIFPAARHDGRPWQANDIPWRRDLVGTPPCR